MIKRASSAVRYQQLLASAAAVTREVDRLQETIATERESKQAQLGILTDQIALIRTEIGDGARRAEHAHGLGRLLKEALEPGA